MTLHKFTLAEPLQAGDSIVIELPNAATPTPPKPQQTPLFWRERLPFHLTTLAPAERNLLSGIHLRLALNTFSVAQVQGYLDALAAQGLQAVVSLKTESSNGNLFVPDADVLDAGDGIRVPDYVRAELMSAYIQAHQQLAALHHPALFAVQLEYGTDGEAIVGKRPGMLYHFPATWGAEIGQRVQAYFDARYEVMFAVCKAFETARPDGSAVNVYSQVALVYHAYYRSAEFYSLSARNHGYKHCGVADSDPADACLYAPGRGFGMVALARYMRDNDLPYAAEPKGLPSSNANPVQAIANLKRYHPDYLVLQSDPAHEGDPAWSWLTQWTLHGDTPAAPEPC